MGAGTVFSERLLSADNQVYCIFYAEHLINARHIRFCLGRRNSSGERMLYL